MGTASARFRGGVLADRGARPEHVFSVVGDESEAVIAGKRHVGDSFGVAALVYNAPTRKYSVRATERTLLLVISKATRP